MAKKKYSKKELKEFRKRRDLSYSNLFYSDQRLDLLVIAISGGGLYVALETMKFFKEHDLEIDTIWLLKLAGIAFVVCIISNFVSQILSKLSNRYDYLMCDYAEDDYCKSQLYDSKSEKFDKLVTVTNWISYTLLFLGLICLMAFLVIRL
ncbi:MAG: hypothetical protein HRT58_21875 [Crocinitomicaceae bacterium]|nr:hypothetical protein [Flavobacteriales bacterium]NQZ38324.1 hypothetical protein [Crocinitomicaceae bacterium]